jgi:predicted adenine nucleotide alpha hydrolase (AANH) superfamily ATPase
MKEYFSQIELKKEEKPKLLVQVCCAPDLVLPLLELKKYFKLYLYWYNPNIQPYSEYKRRYDEYVKLLQLEEGDYEILEDNYDNKEFYRKLFENRHIVGIEENDYKTLMKKFSQMEEKNSKRCDICYYTRLLEPALLAKKHNIPYFTTTLLISPKKSVEKLDKYGKIVTEKTGVKYLSFDFRKNDGFKKAAEYTKEHDIWRQNYCGCAWSIRTN